MMKYSGADRATSERIHGFYMDKKIVAPGAAISEPGIRAVLDSLVATGELKNPPDPADFIDRSFLDEAAK